MSILGGLNEASRADDKLPVLPTERWFESRDEAVAAQPELLEREE